MDGELRSHFIASADGLQLHALTLGAANALTPVVCLPGLSRPARDFVVLARHLNRSGGRRIVLMDYRGRGGSDWDPDWTHYTMAVEHGDLVRVLDALEIAKAIFIGLSRGGLHALTLSAAQPHRVAGIVLNDVGPQLEAQGLAHIKNYIGKLPLLRDIDAAIAHYKRAMGARFPAVSDEDWRFYASNSLNITPERLRLSYDPQLARTLDSFDPSAPLPDMWPLFEAIEAPILALRGENSDLLSPKAHEQMARRNPRCELHVVPGQGHAPLLLDAPTLNRIGAFISGIAG
ncbi:alpha/beta fold hydrolase [Rhodoblastus acidophilus]|uniref:Alpha/beta fold hydrolase n=1 Tax=Rhodoblastus acidophilus TaxID=1074 RepID=A0A6N8DKA4_RHOAC|nr:alpha/beta hydrolase [Rhodoblastus acidophilus]MCW2273988.1 pimeloyl-ACP methyl ester carboxylesterase [Rhodoblastus acidophilus]MTV30869.1 alpha/beta fold hydrolase [Rhodoblastus acidophilus]